MPVTRTGLEYYEHGGRYYTRHDVDQLRTKAATTPERLSDDDLAILQHVVGWHAVTQARENRERAILQRHRPPSAAPVAATTGEAMTTSDTEALANVIVEAIKVPIRPLLERMAALEGKMTALQATVAQVETRAIAPTYAGVFEHGKGYRRGDLVTRSGSLWLALADNARPPGSDATAWRLVVKNGEGGR